MTLDKLPAELIIAISHHLDCDGHKALSQTCRRIRALLRQPRAARALLTRVVGGIPQGAPIYGPCALRVTRLRTYRYLKSWKVSMEALGSGSLLPLPTEQKLTVKEIASSRGDFAYARNCYVHLRHSGKWWTFQQGKCLKGRFRPPECQLQKRISGVQLHQKVVLITQAYGTSCEVWHLRIDHPKGRSFRWGPITRRDHTKLMLDATSVVTTHQRSWLMYELESGRLLYGELRVVPAQLAPIYWKRREAIAVAGEKQVWILAKGADGRLHHCHHIRGLGTIHNLTWADGREQLLIVHKAGLNIVDTRTGGGRSVVRTTGITSVLPLPASNGELLLFRNDLSATLISGSSHKRSISLNLEPWQKKISSPLIWQTGSANYLVALNHLGQVIAWPLVLASTPPGPSGAASSSSAQPPDYSDSLPIQLIHPMADGMP